MCVCEQPSGLGLVTEAYVEVSRRLFLYLSPSLIPGFSKPALGMMLARDRLTDKKRESKTGRMDEGKSSGEEEQWTDSEIEPR